ncbi:AmpG family muropeptide MFS transporter [Novosphingobium terrae]|uniref:AmpG family muropeptide MFS transporter n=1 Tax=Novosphingobium terrae TaxID=2726189 RepID=UPI001F143665|nr:MFS transporter [Novosphingobium terrae]
MASTASDTVQKPARPKGLALLRAALATRKSACMLGLGFASGLPFALLIGTLNAWLGEVGVKLTTIGVLSWIGLCYSFTFLWAPVVDRVRLPGLHRLGRRKGWILPCQVVLVAGIFTLSLMNPAAAIGPFALVAFVCAFASATQDIAINGWRIEAADEDTSLELLTALYQFGHRTSSIVGGAFALFMAARMSWPQVFMVMAGVLAVVSALCSVAPDSAERPEGAVAADIAGDGWLAPKLRTALLGVVLLCWGWAVVTIVSFMVKMLSPLAPGAKPLSVGDFTRTQGPLIVAATVVMPMIVAALAHRLRRQGVSAPVAGGGLLRAVGDHAFSALISPLEELVSRRGWWVLSLLGFILTYALCYNIWASFAYPFYLEQMHYTKDQVAFASKIFGIIMTMTGISLGGYLFTRVGRFPTVFLGAILPPLGNLLYADLADGARGLDAFAHATRLDVFAASMGADAPMLRLLIAICYENISTGMALTAFVAYLSSQVDRRYTAIQYALLSSMVSLVGTLGRGVAGEAFDHYGYGPVFRITALTGVITTVFVLTEWAHAARKERAAKQL